MNQSLYHLMKQVVHNTVPQDKHSQKSFQNNPRIYDDLGDVNENSVSEVIHKRIERNVEEPTTVVNDLNTTEAENMTNFTTVVPKIEPLIAPTIAPPIEPIQSPTRKAPIPLEPTKQTTANPEIKKSPSEMPKLTDSIRRNGGTGMMTNFAQRQQNIPRPMGTSIPQKSPYCVFPVHYIILPNFQMMPPNVADMSRGQSSVEKPKTVPFNPPSVNYNPFGTQESSKNDFRVNPFAPQKNNLQYEQALVSPSGVHQIKYSGKGQNMESAGVNLNTHYYQNQPQHPVDMFPNNLPTVIPNQGLPNQNANPPWRPIARLGFPFHTRRFGGQVPSPIKTVGQPQQSLVVNEQPMTLNPARKNNGMPASPLLTQNIAASFEQDKHPNQPFVENCTAGLQYNSNGQSMQITPNIIPATTTPTRKSSITIQSKRSNNAKKTFEEAFRQMQESYAKGLANSADTLGPQLPEKQMITGVQPIQTYPEQNVQIQNLPMKRGAPGGRPMQSIPPSKISAISQDAPRVLVQFRPIHSTQSREITFALQPVAEDVGDGANMSFQTFQKKMMRMTNEDVPSNSIGTIKVIPAQNVPDTLEPNASSNQKVDIASDNHGTVNAEPMVKLPDISSQRVKRQLSTVVNPTIPTAFPTIEEELDEKYDDFQQEMKKFKHSQEQEISDTYEVLSKRYKIILLESVRSGRVPFAEMNYDFPATNIVQIKKSFSLVTPTTEEPKHNTDNTVDRIATQNTSSLSNSNQPHDLNQKMKSEKNKSPNRRFQSLLCDPQDLHCSLYDYQLPSCNNYAIDDMNCIQMQLIDFINYKKILMIKLLMQYEVEKLYFLSQVEKNHERRLKYFEYKLQNDYVNLSQKVQEASQRKDDTSHYMNKKDRIEDIIKMHDMNIPTKITIKNFRDLRSYLDYLLKSMESKENPESLEATELPNFTGNTGPKRWRRHLINGRKQPIKKKKMHMRRNTERIINQSLK